MDTGRVCVHTLLSSSVVSDGTDEGVKRKRPTCGHSMDGKKPTGKARQAGIASPLILALRPQICTNRGNI